MTKIYARRILMMVIRARRKHVGTGCVHPAPSAAVSKMPVGLYRSAHTSRGFAQDVLCNLYADIAQCLGDAQ